ncbi:hypothetical protein BVY04_02075 [bacterium M21]|nr:hypothetical protein BVY04_02075 [bacterium M21]
MKIGVSLWGQLKQVSKTGELTVDIEGETCSVEDLLRAVSQANDGVLNSFLISDDDSVRRSTLVFRADEQLAGDGAVIQDGDAITLMSPIAGG